MRKRLATINARANRISLRKLIRPTNKYVPPLKKKS